MTSATDHLTRALAVPGRWGVRWPEGPDRRTELTFLLSQCADPDVGALAAALLDGADPAALLDLDLMVAGDRTDAATAPFVVAGGH